VAGAAQVLFAGGFDLDDVSAEISEMPRTDRARPHACEIEHP
jgi:hypothetical protein